jgi:hypothetical protein
MVAVAGLVSKSGAAESGAICSPLKKTIFRVIERGIDEYSRIIPRVRFDMSSLANQTMLGEVPVCERVSA